jgi:membrane protein DedA with SNARE-associated domain
VYAVFGLLLLAAVVPAASELTMLYAGAVAAGAVGHAKVFGTTGTGAYVALVVAGILGNTLGAAIGWWVGDLGGRPLILRYRRFLHVDEAKLDRTERRFERFGIWFVPFGFALPVLRSFVAIPAGIFRVPFGRFLALAVVGISAFCFALAGAGWALGTSYSHARHPLRYLDYVVVAGVVLLVAYLILRWWRRRSSTMETPRADSAG